MMLGPTSFALDVTSHIDSVTVYGEGATVTRIAETDLKTGANAVSLISLPGEIEPEQLQVEVVGEGVELGQVKLETIYRTDAFNAQVNELVGELQTVQRQLAAIADSTKTAELKLKFLNGIAEGYAKEAWFEGARGSADTTSWRGALNVLEEGADAARATQRENAVKTAELNKQVQRLQNEIAVLRGGERAASRIDLELNATRAGTATLKVRYFQGQAHWQPLYEARLDSEGRSLRLSQKAIVEQTTSESWRDVALTLSTSEPSGALQAGDLDSVFVDLEPERKSRMLAMEDRAAGVASSPEVLEEVVTMANRREADTSVSNYAVTYRVPGRVDVANESDDEQSFELDRFAYDVDLITKIVPELSGDAFLTARFTHDQSAPLYGDDMVVYVDGVYVGETYMPTALPEAEVTIPAGQDRRVELTVRDQGAQSSEGGFIGRTKTERTHLLFDITNRRASPTRLEVYGRYPVSKTRDVEVTVHRDATEPDETDFDDKPGVIVWRNTLEGGGSWRIEHRYEVAYPADQRLRRY